jgi:putative ABC transport system ATP-binding protein
MGRMSGELGAPIVTLSYVSKSFESGATINALDGVSLGVPAGSYTAVVGPSGSGKSTLLDLMGLLTQPTSGTITFDGRDVMDLSDAERTQLRGQQIGFVFQSFQLLPRMTLRENVALPLVFRGVSKRTRNERAYELLNRVGLGDRVDDRPTHLSGGQRQRVAIARALATNPPLILADEPTGNLDSATGAQILNLLEELHAWGHALVVVTHSSEVAARADRLVHLRDGRIEQVKQQDLIRVVA